MIDITKKQIPIINLKYDFFSFRNKFFLISIFQFLFVLVSVILVLVGIKSRFLVFSSLKICEELSAKQIQPVGAKSPNFYAGYSGYGSGQFVKDFVLIKRNVFSFLLLPLTTEAMGIGGLREHSLSWNDKVNAGAKTAKCTSASQCP